jgi:hypothetical protein
MMIADLIGGAQGQMSQLACGKTKAGRSEGCVTGSHAPTRLRIKRPVRRFRVEQPDAHFFHTADRRFGTLNRVLGFFSDGHDVLFE